MIDYSRNPTGDVVFDLASTSSVAQIRISLSGFIKIAQESQTEAEFRAELLNNGDIERKARKAKIGE
jgi:hypothetical protein